MSILVAGPSGSGKSTFIHSCETSVFHPSVPPPANTVYGYQIAEKGIPDDAFVHYNLLHAAQNGNATDQCEGGLDCDLKTDPIFRKIMADRRICLAIVLVVPISELVRRAQDRAYVEERVETPEIYDSKLWQKIITSTNLAAVYESLFRHLEQRRIPFIVLSSSGGVPAKFDRSDRVFVPAVLRGEFPLVPSKEDVASILDLPGCHYQSVLMPGGIETVKGQYPHISGSRQETFDIILNRSLWNKSVLDIGCALGDLLYRAERLGAGRLVGVEPHAARYEAATSISSLLCSKAELKNCDFMDMEEEETFDHVFMLNVIHHVKDFLGFLEKGCRLAGKSLTIEFPTLKDAKFAKANGYPLPGILNKLPLIGVSTDLVDQSYVFSPKAIERICCEKIGGFKRVTRLKSPLDNRQIMVFEK